MAQFNLEFVEHLPLKERAALVSGKDFWFTAKGDQYPAVQVSDGPSGLRKQANQADALGVNQSVDAVCFPASSLTACSFDDDLLYHLGQQLGIAARAEKIAVLLGPGINIKRSPLAGRNFEYFSEDPLLAGKMGTAYVKGVQSQGVGVSVKHFAANNRENQLFTSSSNIDERTLREIYLAAFERIVKLAHPATIMCSYNKINGTLNSQNERLLTNILRNQWGFQGLVMSDWGAVADHVAALKAGLDLEMPGKGKYSIDEIVDAVRDGRLDEATLNRSVLRVLKLVAKFAHPKSPAATYNKEQQHDFARHVADNSIVLLKNEGQLPLDNHNSVAIIGELAAKPRYQGGGSSHVNAHHVVTPLAAAPKNTHYAKGYSLDGNDREQDMAAAVKLAQQSDQVIFFAGFPEEMETEGFDKSTISLPENQTELLERVSMANDNVTVVLQNGSAVEMPWADQVPAIVETYLAGEAVGEATWDVLTGKVNPSGKLAESFPLRLVDNPTYGTFGRDLHNENYSEGLMVGYRYYDLHHYPVRFPFGHGLSYTSFDYRDLSVTESKNDVTVRFKLTNTGKLSGKEVPQLYVRNQTSRVVMPAQELRDFVKVELAPGESQTIEFHLNRRAFSWYNPEKQQWESDNGTYEIAIGSSSRDIRLTKHFKLTIGEEPTEAINTESYVGDVLNSPDDKVQTALKKSGLQKVLQPLAKSDGSAIFLNMPIRSLVMMGIDPEIIQRFIELTK
ncbi:glycoside hydrolase family 3 C-terminal domain-containing protein [Limosilactobacillus secaliphilus]|uniref:Thermostable beta-glucosidase B n=1 Tax=Limosilactobacillus secaliphilus TaxID=396268 RepID=A0A0R2I152_9LACO|nr:glycoside hydrolase family 3 C-terminal domain-containing protein [Limosilactobacillus secaliphilus]KRN58896.1 thermostable beta-glucosidase B [Limosilactobacillus secaliphilus]